MLVMLAAIAAFVGLGIGDFLGPLLTRRTPALTVIVGAQTLPMALLFVVAIMFAVEAPGGAFVAKALLAGMMTALATFLAFRAGQIGHIGLVAVILALSAVIPAAGGVLQGERPPSHQWLGIMLAAGGTGLTLLAGEQSRRRGARDTAAAPVRAPGMPLGAATPAAARPPAPVVSALRSAGGNWAFLAVAAAIMFGLFMLIYADLARQNLVWATAVSRLSMILTAAAAILLLGRSVFGPGDRRRQFLPLPLLGLIMTAAIFLFGYAASSMQTVASALTAFSPVVTVTLGWIILRERLTRRQLTGIGIAVFGLILIAV